VTAVEDDELVGLTGGTNTGEGTSADSAMGQRAQDHDGDGEHEAGMVVFMEVPPDDNVP